MSLVNRNLVANLVGKSWTTFLSLILFSTYIRFLGLEAYGLIGFYNTLLVFLAPFDFGLSTAANREIAKLSTEEVNPSIPNFIRTLEWIFWISAFCLGIAFLGLAPYISTHWLCPENLPSSTVTKSLSYMAIAIMLQWPSTFYAMSLMGLQKQVLLNIILVSFGTLRAGGILLLFGFIQPSIEMFFIWQIIINLMQTVILKILIWRQLPNTGMKPCFDKQSLLRVKNFALGTSGISLTAIILTNLDKIILSKILPLENFGEYAFVTTLATSVTLLSGPLFSSHFPRLAQLVTKDQPSELIDFYHLSAQKLALLIIPFSLTIIFFSRVVLSIVLGNQPEISILPTVLSLYMIGSLLNGFMIVPYALQLAIGWTQLAFYQNLVIIALLSTSLIFVALHYGAIGAAAIWLILNACYILITIPIMHRRVLQGEMQKWYIKDLIVPTLSALIGILIARLLFPPPSTLIAAILEVFFAFSISLLFCVLSTDISRKKLIESFSKY